jgi:hypothetical protein
MWHPAENLHPLFLDAACAAAWFTFLLAHRWMIAGLSIRPLWAGLYPPSQSSVWIGTVHVFASFTTYKELECKFLDILLQGVLLCPVEKKPLPLPQWGWVANVFVNWTVNEVLVRMNKTESSEKEIEHDVELSFRKLAFSAFEHSYWSSCIYHSVHSLSSYLSLCT